MLAMLLQMALEKLSKAALLRGGSLPVDQARRSHRAASTLVRLIGRDRRVCKQLGFEQKTVNRYLVPLVDELERSQPSLAQGGPCLEYPWEDLGGKINWPARDLPMLRLFTSRSMQGRLLFDLVERLARHFEAAFP